MESKIIILIIAILFVVGNLSLILDSLHTSSHIEDSVYKPHNDSHYDLEDSEDDEHVYDDYLGE